MQILRTRQNHNTQKEDLEQHDTIDSDELRIILSHNKCQMFYEAIFEHMLNIIEDKSSTVQMCSAYLSEALVNYYNANAVHKKMVEKSIANSMDAQNRKRKLNKSKNLAQDLNNQFLSSPENSDADIGYIIKPGKKKGKNKDFELDYGNLGLDDVDKQEIDDDDFEYEEF